MTTIDLGHGHTVRLDDEDVSRVKSHRWRPLVQHRADGTVKKVYAIAYIRRKDGKQRSLRMHRMIVGVIDPKTQVDHKDHDGLNNQKKNLRIATNTQNMQHGRKRTSHRGHPPSSRFKGVCWDKSRRRWMAYITVNGKRKYFGRFVSEIEAARVYNKAAAEYFGEFAETTYLVGL